MTEQTPPPPRPPTPAATTPPAGAPTDDVTETPSSSGGGARKAIIGGIAAAVVLGGGYGAYAVYDRLDGGGAQPHDVLPASTQAYARIDLDPSASQKIELFKLIRKFPDLAEEIGVKNEGQDVRELFVEEVIASECDDIDFQDDVEPWLGDRIGVGGNIADETFAVAVQVTDEKQARDGIKKLFACSQEDYGIAFLDGYAILSDSQKAADASVKETEKGALGEKDEFVESFDDLGEQGVVSAWADAKAIVEIPDLKAELESSGQDLGDLDKLGSFAAALRVDDGALELAALGEIDEKLVGTGSKSDLSTLPADTVAGLSLAGGGEYIADQFDSFVEQFDSEVAAVPSDEELEDYGLTREEYLKYSGEPEDAQSYVEELEQETGLDAEEDLRTLLGDELTLAVGGRNLQDIPTLSGPDDVAGLDIALSLRSDPAKAFDLVERLADLAEQAGITLTTSKTDDGAVLATNQEFADAVADPDGELGEEKVFRSAIPDGKTDGTGLFVDIGAIVDALQKADPPPEIADVLDQLEPLSATGFSGRRLGADRMTFSYRLTFR